MKTGRFGFGLKTVLLGLMAAALLGCPNPNLYQTPRTVPPGEIQHTLAAEGIHLQSETKTVTPGTTASGQPTSTVSSSTNSLTDPMFPSYMLRVGLADTVDIGLRVPNLDSLGFDVKWNFYRSQGFDLAIDPMAQAMYFSIDDTKLFISYFNIPIIAGINVTDSAVIVLTGGFSAAYASASVTNTDSAEANGGGIGAMGALGVQFRVGEKLALHPAVSVTRFFTGPAGDGDALSIVFGFGFNFGKLPIYGSPPAATDPAPPK